MPKFLTKAPTINTNGNKAIQKIKRAVLSLHVHITILKNYVKSNNYISKSFEKAKNIIKILFSLINYLKLDKSPVRIHILRKNKRVRIR